MNETLATLIDLASRHAGRGKAPTPIDRVAIHRGETPTGPLPGIYEPMVCLVLQGGKQVTIGEAVLDYTAGDYFVSAVDVPTIGRVVDASPLPYIGVSLAIDPDEVTALLMDLDARPTNVSTPGFAVSAATPDLLDAWLRMLRLIDRPDDIAALAPMLRREIVYRLLQGSQGAMLRQIGQGDSRLSRIRRAIAWLRAHYAEPIRVERLADLAGMSPASFHRHFKTVTAMSPLQYQKQIRLQEARQLLRANTEAAQAAFAVGYESPSQFSREYARRFGAPPARDAAIMRAAM